MNRHVVLVLLTIIALIGRPNDEKFTCLLQCLADIGLACAAPIAGAASLRAHGGDVLPVRSFFSYRGRFPGDRSGWRWADEASEGRNLGSTDAQARSEVMVESDFEFQAGLAEPDHHVASVAAFVANRSA